MRSFPDPDIDPEGGGYLSGSWVREQSNQASTYPRALSMWREATTRTCLLHSLDAMLVHLRLRSPLPVLCLWIYHGECHKKLVKCWKLHQVHLQTFHHNFLCTYNKNSSDFQRGSGVGNVWPLSGCIKMIVFNMQLRYIESSGKNVTAFTVSFHLSGLLIGNSAGTALIIPGFWVPSKA